LARIAHYLAFVLTVGASVVTFVTTRGNPTPLYLVFYPWICVPIVIAAIPFRWPGQVSWAALGLLVFVFFPLSLSIGIFYIPALVVMGISAAIFHWRAIWSWN
jgi:hypothetical protein